MVRLLLHSDVALNAKLWANIAFLELSPQFTERLYKNALLIKLLKTDQRTTKNSTSTNSPKMDTYLSSFPRGGIVPSQWSAIDRSIEFRADRSQSVDHTFLKEKTQPSHTGTQFSGVCAVGLFGSSYLVTRDFCPCGTRVSNGTIWPHRKLPPSRDLYTDYPKATDLGQPSDGIFLRSLHVP